MPTSETSTGPSTDPAATAREGRDRLDERYGRSPGRRRRLRLLGGAAGVAAVVVSLLWVVFVAFDGDGSELEVRDTGYEIVSDRAVDARYTVSTDPGTPVRCAVQALNDVQAIVGWKVVDLPGVDTRSTTYTTSLVTTERAVTGLIYRCWLP